MTEESYHQLLAEMRMPASRLMVWMQALKESFYPKFGLEHQHLIDEGLRHSHNLISVLEDLSQHPMPELLTYVFTHELGGSIGAVRSKTWIILKETEGESNHRDWVKKAHGAAEYLYQIKKDTVYQLMIEQNSNTTDT
jgi:hypothetical protein